VHPLVAQTWRSRFPKSVVLGVNTGFRPGFVHFAGRAPAGIPWLRFLRDRAPAGSGETYGGGHDQAAGGALPVDVWNAFASDLGFGAELQA
jgi:single-stranded-DNA-specific exonuclease